MIKKLFIKNYKNTNDKNVRNNYGKVSGVFGIITNAILGIIKLLIGILSNSISIIVDAVNSLSDMVTSILTIVGFKLSSKKPNHKHPYGYARYEYVFGLFISIFMLAVGIIFIKESITKILKPESLEINTLTFVILIISIILKIIQMIVYFDFANSIKSKTLKANAVDTRNDILTTTSILISMIIMKIFNVNIDGYVGLLVSLFVVYSSYKMIREVLEPIIGIIPSKDQVNKIKSKIMSYDCVLGIHDLVIHNYGVGNDFVIVHIEVDSNLTMIKAHDLIDEIENDFKKEGIDLTIHIDPVIIGDKKLDKIKEMIDISLKKLDKKISIHDFRIIEGKYQTKVLFDCVIPYEKEYTKKQLIKHLINDIPEKYIYDIEIDRPFC